MTQFLLLVWQTLAMAFTQVQVTCDVNELQLKWPLYDTNYTRHIDAINQTREQLLDPKCSVDFSNDLRLAAFSRERNARRTTEPSNVSFGVRSGSRNSRKRGRGNCGTLEPPDPHWTTWKSVNDRSSLNKTVPRLTGCAPELSPSMNNTASYAGHKTI